MRKTPEPAAGTAGALCWCHIRFSTVRMADLIVVISDGKIAELGSHADLMTRGGAYCDLYSIQARAYK
jgi:ATP-binding cassette subfamily B protein